MMQAVPPSACPRCTGVLPHSIAQLCPPHQRDGDRALVGCLLLRIRCVQTLDERTLLIKRFSAQGTDRPTTAQRREMDLGVGALHSIIAQCDAVRIIIGQGRYGLCQICGAEIDIFRIAALTSSSIPVIACAACRGIEPISHASENARPHPIFSYVIPSTKPRKRIFAVGRKAPGEDKFTTTSAEA